MFKINYASLLLISLTSRALCIGVDLLSDDQDDLDDNPDKDGRLFPILIATGINLNNTLALAALAALGALAALLPLLALAGLLAGYLLSSNDSGYGHDSGYAGYRSLGIDLADWQKYSLIDWLMIGEETFRKFDPSDLECWKRLICEVHQNKDEFGDKASTFIQLFSSIRYLKLLGVLDNFIDFGVDELLDAADRGLSLSKDCGQIFSTCNFSIKNIAKRVSSN